MRARKSLQPRIVIIANTAWYLWNFRVSLMRLLQRQGVEVVAMAPVDDYAQRFASLGIRFIPLPLSRRGKNPLRECCAILRLYRIFRRERPGVILTYTPKANIYASFAAHACGIPIVNNVAGLGYAFVRTGLLPRLIKILYKLAFSRSRTVFFQNNDDMALFIEEGIVPAAIAERLPGSGVDTATFTPREKERGPFTFLLVARLLWDKGIGEYVQAARTVRGSHPDAVFRLLGPLDDGNPSAISRAQVEAWHAEGIIEYHGTTDAVADLLAEADCVVLPSAYREGVPRSLLEGASMAKPVITTDAPGCRDVVEDGVSGFLCKVRDAGDLAEKMTAVLALGSAELKEMGEQGRLKMLRQFSEEIVLNRYAQLVSLTLGLAPAPVSTPVPAANRVRVKGVKVAADLAEEGVSVKPAA